MFQTCSNSQLLRRVLWISAEQTIGASLKHKNTQPLYIFNRVRVLHLNRLKEQTWLHSFAIAHLRIKCVTETKNVSALFYKNLKSWLTHLTLRFLYIIGSSGPRWCARCASCGMQMHIRLWLRRSRCPLSLLCAMLRFTTPNPIYESSACRRAVATVANMPPHIEPKSPNLFDEYLKISIR